MSTSQPSSQQSAIQPPTDFQPPRLPISVAQPMAQLTEDTSIALANRIQREAIATPLRLEPIATAYVSSAVASSSSPLDDGDRAPILMIHGFDSSLLEFRRLWPQLGQTLAQNPGQTQTQAQTRELWLVDLLGFGFSDRPRDIPLNPSTIKRHLLAFIEQKIQRPVVLVGASMGGAAAIDFCLSHPQWVEKLVLLDSAGYQNGPVIGKFLFPPLDQWAVEFLRRPDVRRKISLNAYCDGDRWVTPDAELCAQLHLHMPGWDAGLKAFTKSGGYPKLRSQLPQISVDTLLIWGRQDKILGTKDAVPFAQAIPRCELVWIDQAGHVPHLEKPQEVAAAIAQFLRPSF